MLRTSAPTHASAPAAAENLTIGDELARNSLLGWADQFSGPHALLELAIVALVLVALWGLLRRLQRTLNCHNPNSVLFGHSVYDGVLLPLLAVAVLYVAQRLLEQLQPVLVLPLASAILNSLLLIRLGVKVLNAAFPGKAWVGLIARSLSWLVWLSVVLWLIGLGPTILRELDALSWTIGGKPVSLLRLLESALTAALFLLVSLWASSAIENQLMHSALGARPPLRKAIATAIRAVLLLVGLLLALNMAGIDLTALSVFGGALGVGIGLGLQRLAANYVSGFVVITERVFRVGDVVRVNGFEGTITEMSGRYTAIVATNGREAIVPHEMLTNSMVEKIAPVQPWLQSISLVVEHGNDVPLVRRLMAEAAAHASRRVMATPAPAAMLMNFTLDGLEFKLNYSIADAHLAGLEALRSDINLAILAAFDAHGVRLAATVPTVDWQQFDTLVGRVVAVGQAATHAQAPAPEPVAPPQQPPDGTPARPSSDN